MKDKSEKWKTQDGFAISIQDCIDSLFRAISVISKEIAYNNQIKDNPRMKKEYKKSIEILTVIKDKYQMAGLMAQQVKQVPVKKRPQKKSRIIMPGDNN